MAMPLNLRLQIIRSIYDSRASMYDHETLAHFHLQRTYCWSRGSCNRSQHFSASLEVARKKVEKEGQVNVKFMEGELQI